MIYHLTERHGAPLNWRKRRAFASWEDLYATGKVVPVHFWVTADCRTADKTIGDPRPLPYLLDELWHGLTAAKTDSDLIVWTNDDTILHPDIIKQLSDFRKNSFFSGHRVEVPIGNPDGYCTVPVEKLSMCKVEHPGRDLFAFTRNWLRSHIGDIPDFIHGASEWDLCLATMMRLLHKLPTKWETLSEQHAPCDLPLGYVIHESHTSSWLSDWHKTPSEKHNVDLTRNWFLKHMPEQPLWGHLNYE